MAYHTLMAELEALEKAPAARAPRYKQQFGARDELFYASMRRALQSIKPATDCTPISSPTIEPAIEKKGHDLFAHVAVALKTGDEDASDPSDEDAVRGKPRERAGAMSSKGPHDRAARHPPPFPTHPFLQGMLRGKGKSMNDVVGPERGEPAAFSRSANDLRPALRRTSVCSSTKSHVSFDSSV